MKGYHTMIQSGKSFRYDRMLPGRHILLAGYRGILSGCFVPALREHGAEVSEAYLPPSGGIDAFGPALDAVTEPVDSLIYLIPPVRWALIPDAGPEEARQLTDQCLVGLHAAVRKVLPGMREKRAGTLVAVTSDYALTAVPGVALYAAASAAVNAYIRAAAVEWCKYGIRANTVLCGFNTADNGEVYKRLHGEDAEDAFRRYQPLERAGTAEDIIHAVLFLSCGMSDFITGENLPADGGAMIVGHSQVWHPKGRPAFEYPRKEEQP